MRFFKKSKKETTKKPQICLSLNCKTVEGVIEEIEEFIEYADLVEWCVDETEGSENYTKEEFIHKLLMIKSFCLKKPLIIDYKKDEATGNKIQRWALGYADIIDIDANNSEVNKLVKEAKRKKTKTLISHHVFEGMPPKDEIATQFVRMEKTNGDILKIACYAENEIDTYAVLEDANVVKIDDISKPRIHKIKNDM